MHVRDAFSLISMLNIKNPDVFPVDDPNKKKHFYFRCFNSRKKVTYRLCKQIRVKKDDEKPFDKTDGFLLMSGHSQTKIKPPTVDVKIVNGKIVDNDYFKNNFFQKENGIYEITETPNKGIIFLRRRLENDFPSTKRQFETYLLELERLYGK